ncbi:MAG: glycosyl hydrolase-related protein [Clostridia bacterium]
MSDKSYTLDAVTKTHWDREWYMNFQKTRIKLVHLIDGLLEILDNDPEFVSFMMDGQTLPLEDYLAVKPHNRERLQKYIKQGRIVIGPWYILPDEVLITGESHVRNYLLGTRVANSFGATKMQIGYLPDSFGHPSQMPQILDKLGMDTIMFWRGATQEINRTEFFWCAPDGTRVLTVLMPDGYCTGAELSEDPAITAARLDQFIEGFSKYATTDKIYLSNGGDHLEPSPYLSKMLTQANQLMKNGQVIHTTLPNFVHELKRSLKRDELKEISGELCGVSRSILLFSTLSTRTYLKQENHAVSRLLENELEPIFALSMLSGDEYPRDILVTAWKYLMENLPHDSICGCSIDDVHRDMLARYNQVREIGEHLFEIARQNYGKIDTNSITGDGALVVFNTTGSNRDDYVEATVDLDARLTNILDFNRTDDKGRYPHRDTDATVDALRDLPTAIHLFDGETELPCVLLDARVSNYMELGYRHFPHQYNVNRCRIGFVARDIPSVGYKTLSIVAEYGRKDVPAMLDSVCIQNEFFTVEPNVSDGSITVTDLVSGRVLVGLNRLCDDGDCGDEYTYCPPDKNEVVYADPTTLYARMVERSAARQSFEMTGIMHLPIDVEERSKHRSAELVECPFTTLVTLYPGVHRVDIKTIIENHARYHRLRVVFPTTVKADVHWSAGTFSVDSRKMRPDLDPNWRELCYTHQQKDFCELNDGHYGLTIANRGLHEYEAFDEGEQSCLAVTLLRCTGVISQCVLKTRDEMGGWSEEAPDAQCQGRWTFEYSIIPHNGNWIESRSYEQANGYNLPMPTLQIPVGQKGVLPTACTRISMNSPALQMSAFKQCEFEDAMILRFFNTIPDVVDAQIRFNFTFADVKLANLREDTIGSVDMRGNVANMRVKPFEIVTLKIIL